MIKRELGDWIHLVGGGLLVILSILNLPVTASVGVYMTLGLGLALIAGAIWRASYTPKIYRSRKLLDRQVAYDRAPASLMDIEDR